MSANIPNASKFFAIARERYKIKLRKDAGEPWPWTMDTHLQTWRFTNIFREDDRTTVWFRRSIRDPLSEKYRETNLLSDFVHIVEATMIFRWFNRVETGQKILDLILTQWDSQIAQQRLMYVDPVFTGAYIIIGKPHMPKLDGVLAAIDDARPRLPRMVAAWDLIPPNERTLEGVWNDLKTIDYIGGFNAHEIVQDLRYTPVLDQATDIMTWGNLGPGAIRGISWLVYGHGDGFSNSATQQKTMLALMAELLEMSKDPANWPAEWPPWEMHQVEFLLCETAKYFRAYNGHRQKRKYTR